MSLRRRIALLAGAAVAVAIVLASCAAYVLVREELRREVDASLTARAQEFTGRGGGPAGGFGRPGGRPGRDRGFPGHGDGGDLRRPPRRRRGTD